MTRGLVLDDRYRLLERPGAGKTGETGDLSEFDGISGADNLTTGDLTGRRRTAVTYASVAAGTLLPGVPMVGTMWRGLGASEPVQENQERLPAVQPGKGDSVRRLPASQPPRANPSAPDPTPAPTGGTTPAPQDPGPALSEGGPWGSGDKV